jgi:hypothetical protein
VIIPLAQSPPAEEEKPTDLEQRPLAEEKKDGRE